MKSQLTHSALRNLWLGKRIKAMMLELLYSLSVFIPFAFPIGMISIISKPRPIIGEVYNESLGIWNLVSLALFNLMMLTILNKDFFNGQSIVNRVLGYQVIDMRTRQPANEIKCMLRNVTFPIWPIEGIFALISPQRRIGDFIAGTKLIAVEISDPEKIFVEMKEKTLDRRVIVTLLFSIVALIAYGVVFDPRNWARF